MKIKNNAVRAIAIVLGLLQAGCGFSFSLAGVRVGDTARDDSVEECASEYRAPRRVGAHASGPIPVEEIEGVLTDAIMMLNGEKLIGSIEEEHKEHYRFIPRGKAEDVLIEKSKVDRIRDEAFVFLKNGERLQVVIETKAKGKLVVRRGAKEPFDIEKKDVKSIEG